MKGRIAHALVPDSLERGFGETAAQVARSLDQLRGELEEFDHTLAAALDKSRAKILYQIEKAGRKIARETMHRDERATGDANYLSALLYPQRHLQERFYTILPFPRQARFGSGRYRLYQAVESDCPDHRVLYI